MPRLYAKITAIRVTTIASTIAPATSITSSKRPQVIRATISRTCIPISRKARTLSRNTTVAHTA